MSSAAYTLSLCLAGASAVLAVQAVQGQMREAGRAPSLPNFRRRLRARLQAKSDAPVEGLALERLRLRRGLERDGRMGEFVLWLRRIILHSGVPARLWQVVVASAALAPLAALAVWQWKETPSLALAAGLAGLAAPTLALRFLGKRRRLKAVSQLPEALDVIVRSLAAGHPIPVALRMVGREMPDPIGTEFGMACDEVGFGAGVSQSVQRMAERIDHEDVYLFAAMLRLQERTGGNLAELLRANAKTIRDRQSMRLKIRAASAEGRMSAVILNLTPVGIYLIVGVMAPDFYGDVEGHPWVEMAFWGAAIWMGLGNLVMRRMINFRI